MAFTESMKADLRRRADMRCCICHAVGIEIHHIEPQAEEGEDSEVNAVPLCPACHETYGANPAKRKFIREAKKNWLAACTRMTEGPTLYELTRIAAEGRVTKEDLSILKQELLSELREILRPRPGDQPDAQPIGEILRFFYDLKTDSTKVRPIDVDLVHHLVWDTTVHADELDQIKMDFVNTFGTAMARALIRQVLQRHNTRALADGFTDEDMQQVVNWLSTSMIMLLHHPDINPKDFAIDLAIGADGHLLGRLKPSAAPTGGPATPVGNSEVTWGRHP